MTRRKVKKFLLGLVGVVVIAVAISLFSAATASTSSRYTVTDLGLFNNYSFTIPWRINDLGEVVGRSKNGQIPKTPEHAFLWQKGKMTDLAPLSSSSSPFDINNVGQVVGMTLTNAGFSHAFLWENGKISDLGTKGSNDSSIAYGINNKGQVVGWSFNDSSNNPRPHPNQSYRAVLWQNGSITDLGTLSGDNFSQAFSINNKGQVFGWSFNLPSNSTAPPKTVHIFRWQDGAMTNLGELVTPQSCPYPLINDINNRGQVVGFFNPIVIGFFNPICNDTAFLWQSDTITQLGTLGGIFALAYNINEAGIVVGESYIHNSTSHAFLWRNGKLTDLNNLLPPNSGWILEGATGINNKGQIVGIGKFNGQPRGFLLTPRGVAQ